MKDSEYLEKAFQIVWELANDGTIVGKLNEQGLMLIVRKTYEKLGFDFKESKVKAYKNLFEKIGSDVDFSKSRNLVIHELSAYILFEKKEILEIEYKHTKSRTTVHPIYWGKFKIWYDENNLHELEEEEKDTIIKNNYFLKEVLKLAQENYKNSERYHKYLGIYESVYINPKGEFRTNPILIYKNGQEYRYKEGNQYSTYNLKCIKCFLVGLV